MGAAAGGAQHIERGTRTTFPRHVCLHTCVVLMVLMAAAYGGSPAERMMGAVLRGHVRRW